MALTDNTYTGDGSTVLFSFTFPYLTTSDVKVQINGVDTSAYTLANATTVQMNSAPADGATVRVYRSTPDVSLQATFYPGSAIRAVDLNENFTQSFYINQEVKERALDSTGGLMTGTLDMDSNRIINLPTPSASGEASTKGYVDGLITTHQAQVDAAAASASAAASSQSAAATSATNSANSATASANSATASATSATNSGTSATNSANSATASAASASAASTSATAAAGSASAASTSASNALTSANNSANSASNASTSASNASTSATAAANSATSAATSAASALAAFDSFDDRYLGAKASDPTVDNDGDPLNAGDLYYNTTSSVMKVYTGTAWVVAYVPGDAINISFTPYSTIVATNVQNAVQELTDEKLNLTGGTLTGNLVLNNQNDVRFGEATANGSNYVGFQAPSSIAADVIWTLPNADATVSGHALKSDAAGNLSWGTAGGAAGGGTDDVFYENSQTVTSSYSLTAGKNAMSAGPITINSGATVTVGSGQSWVIV